MRHQSSKPTHVQLCEFVVKCPTHGQHKLVIGGLDTFAGLAASYLLNALTEDGWICEEHTTYVPLSAARAAVAEELRHDDLPL